MIITGATTLAELDTMLRERGVYIRNLGRFTKSGKDHWALDHTSTRRGMAVDSASGDTLALALAKALEPY